MNVNLCWPANTGMFMCRNPLENGIHELILTSLACLAWMVCEMKKEVAKQLLFCKVLLLGFFVNSIQHACIVPV